MTLSIRADLKLPLVEQVEQGIRERIARGELRGGERLRSIRTLANDLAVSRNTVIEAYDRLMAKGLIRSRQGSGYFVENAAPGLVTPGGSSNPQEANEIIDNLWHLFDDQTNQLKLGCGWLPENWRDQDDISYAIRQVARQDSAGVFNYSTPLGSANLRENLQRRLKVLNIDVATQQIMLTTGASHALDLLIRYLLKPGDVVLVETPGYYNLFGLLKLQGIRMISVPRTPQGPDLDELERLLTIYKPKLFFLNSVFQNPTGTTITPSTAHRILQLAEKFDFLVVEDDIYADLQSDISIRLAALDKLRRVIYVGSFSKSLSCSLRVGFIAAAPAMIQNLVNVKMLTSISSSRFSEEVVTVMLENGSYRKSLERLRRRLELQMTKTLSLLEGNGWCVFARPSGGMFIWARRPDISDSSVIVAAAKRRGISLSPGSVFTPDMDDCPWLRINVTYASDPRAIDFLSKPF